MSSSSRESTTFSMRRNAKRDAHQTALLAALHEALALVSDGDGLGAFAVLLAFRDWDGTLDGNAERWADYVVDDLRKTMLSEATEAEGGGELVVRPLEGGAEGDASGASRAAPRAPNNATVSNPSGASAPAKTSDTIAPEPHGRPDEITWAALPFGARLNFTVQRIRLREHPPEQEIRWLLKNRSDEGDSTGADDIDAYDFFKYVAYRWVLGEGPGGGRKTDPHGWRGDWDIVFTVRRLQAYFSLGSSSRGAFRLAIARVAEHRRLKSETVQRTYRRAAAALKKRADDLKRQARVGPEIVTGWDPPTAVELMEDLAPLSAADRAARVRRETDIDVPDLPDSNSAKCCHATGD